MQPTILSPVPFILFSGGSVYIVARYNSGTGAPMQKCEIGVATGKVSLACSVVVDGETFSGSAAIADIVQADTTWSVGHDLTIIARTMEAGKWSETHFSARTCGDPSVSLTSGYTTLSAFPHAVTWDYSDVEGFWQCGWVLRITGSRIMGDVELRSYTNSHEALINGSEIAYAADLDGTVDSLHCSLDVLSTSGAVKTLQFDLVVSGNPKKPAITNRPDGGRLLVESSLPFQLFALGDNPQRAAYSDSGQLLFSLPDSSTRLVAVTLDEARIGRGDELYFSGEFCGYLDYVLDGGKRRLDVSWDGGESSSFSSSSDLVHFAGRKYPVAYMRDSVGTFNISCSVDDADDAVLIAKSIEGVEAVYRPQCGGLYRVVIDKASSSIGDTDGFQSVAISCNVVDGSPYSLLYDDPFFEDIMLYPGVSVYPGKDTYPRR